jgi:flagellar basal body-associated protein FliL
MTKLLKIVLVASLLIFSGGIVYYLTVTSLSREKSQEASRGAFKNPTSLPWVRGPNGPPPGAASP